MSQGGKDLLGEIINLQRKLQEKIASEKGIYAVKFGSNLGLGMPIAYAAEFMISQMNSLNAEYYEMLNALGGADGSAAWKYWKTKHQLGMYKKTLYDLSKEELDHLKEEYIDMLHFFINMSLVLEMTSDEMFEIYARKNGINIDRQNSKY